MIGYLRICNLVHAFCLLLWAAVLIASAIAAMNVFGTLGDMDFTLRAYPGAPPDEHPLLAAGLVMDGVFRTVDAVQFVVAPLAVLTLAVQLVVFRVGWRRPSNLVRTACLVAAAALLGWYAFGIAPEMNRHLQARWSAAAGGDAAQAALSREAFNELHPRAELVLQVNLILVLIAVGAGVVALGPDRCPGESPLEKPALSP